jgi:hypothetical protein
VISFDALIAELQPPARALVDLGNRAAAHPRITSTFRTHSEQAKLYAAYLRGGRAYPVAPPGSSAHEYGWAFDLVVDGEQNQLDLGSVWKSWGGFWAASDPIHFEYPGFSAVRSSLGTATSTATKADLCGPWTKGIAEDADLILGFVPGIGELELVAWLLSLGFPNSAILDFLSSPVSAVTCR